MYNYLQQVLPRVVIYRTQVAKNKLEVASTVQPYEGEPRASNEDFDEDFDEDWQRRFLACGFQVKKRTKKSLYWIFSLLRLCFVSMVKSMLRMGSVFVSVAIPFHSFALSAAKVPLARCSRVSLLSSNSHSKPKANFWRKNQLYHEARWFFAEKSSSSFTASCSFPRRVQRQRLSLSSRSNGKRVNS